MPHYHYDLSRHNTFGLQLHCALFYHITHEHQLLTLASSGFFRQNKYLLLGGGSNMLFVNDFYDGAILHLDLRGRHIRPSQNSMATLTAAAGENWHQTVLYALENNLGGIENLSLIPGNCGTAPVQNIGAYGVELSQVLESVSGIHLLTGEKITLSNQECHFGYRESIFKHQLKDRFAITSITLKLTTKNHQLHTHYGTITDELQKMNVTNPTIHHISQAVIAIRQSKLPDPAILGNCGSFFKNPIISAEKANQLKSHYPDLPTYPTPEGTKIPAGWLIEKAGWKGRRIGNVGMHEKQALVLVNYGNATGKELWNHAQTIMADIQHKFGITLQPEVNIIH
ncbi:UDP-N-acetylenolpyruvoylglucosamine reductase [Schleiferia thermophila str. Yellowstone]|nr:UDP-N-acetylenolpyruvoylglucosamine reductase [Schleiferia thermophila str. Yellowstone]